MGIGMTERRDIEFECLDCGWKGVMSVTDFVFADMVKHNLLPQHCGQDMIWRHSLDR